MLAKACRSQVSGRRGFKIVTRVDKASQLARWLKFMEKRPTGINVTAMGVGKLGAASRIDLSRLGSAMVYAHMGVAMLEGQPSLSKIRRLLQARSQQRTRPP
jgi:3-dehydroquinate dehydratase